MWLDKTCQGLGTRIRLAFDLNGQEETAWLACQDLLAKMEQTFSAHLPQSELSRLNQAAGSAPVPLSKDLFDLIALGKAASLAPDSQINIALGPVIQAWRIGFSDARQPGQADLDQLLPLCRPDLIELDENLQTCHLALPGMALDLGALAKGYIADRLLDLLKELGARSALIDLGGNVLTYGQPSSGQPHWLVGVQKPFAPRGQSIGQIKLANQALVTSGVYERFFETAGASFHHILDDQTGYPIQSSMTSISVLAPNALTAEIWTSRLFGLPIETALAWLNQTSDIDGIILTDQNTCLLSDGIREHFSPLYNN